MKPERCAYCGDMVDIPFECTYCKDPFCDEHRLPEDHRCVKLTVIRAKKFGEKKVITMHISTSIEEKKLELQKALIDGLSVILVPRPWPKVPEKHFMQSEIAKYLKQNGFDTSKMKVHVYESITTENETSFEGTVEQLEGKEFSDLSVMVFNQATLESYINFD